MKTRRILAGLPNEKGLFHIGDDVLVEVLEPKVRFDHQHIVSTFPKNLPFEAGFEGGPVIAFWVKNGICDVDTGAVFDRDNNLIEESFGTLPLVDRYLSLAAKSDETPILESERLVLPLANLRMANYCRWWLDSVAKLAVKQMATSLPSGEIDVYVPKKLKTPFQRDSVDLLKRNVSIRHARRVRGDIVSSPGVTYLGGQRIGKSVLEAAKILKRLIYQPSPDPGGLASRIFITRQNASIRRIVDEDLVFAALKPLGFEKVDLSELSVRRQCEIFDSAEIIVSPHGAGLTNLMWSNDSLRLVEIFSEKGVHGSAFLRLSSHIGLRYHAFVGDDGENRDKRDNPNNSDIIVDPVKLASFIRNEVLP